MTPGLVDFRKERARLRAETMRILLAEAFLKARAGKVTWNHERSDELFEAIEAFAPMLREMKDDFAHPQDYAVANTVCSMILHGRRNGGLFERRLLMLMSMIKVFAELFDRVIGFLEIREHDVVDAEVPG